MTTAAVALGAPPDEPLVLGSANDAELTQELLAPVRGTSLTWWVLFAISVAGTLLYIGTISYTVARGIGVWGNNIPVAWAFAITNFVWWIGIGHAGTFISAFLILLHQHWRASINRLAEAMTIFALVNAGIFPLLHLGRPWFAYWLVPYPSTMGVWPNFKSSLPWDVAAVTTYFTVSLLFWYLGLVPDLATARDSLTGRIRRRIYGVFALGWSGSGREWSRYNVAYVLLAALATPLVISVHSVVSLDFAIAQLPGWHSTIFPPYFVVGAIYSGLAMVVLLLLPLRRAYRWDNVMTARHLDSIAKLMLAMALLLTLSYAIETFVGWYSGNPTERYVYLTSRPFGPYAILYWILIACNIGAPQFLWSRRLRSNTTVLALVSVAILIGMWLERFVIIASSLNRDFLTSSWHIFVPTWVDFGILAGSLGMFSMLFLLFVRFVPSVAMSEVKALQFAQQQREQREQRSARDA